MKTGFLHKKATQSLNYFSIKEGGSINKMKSLKLVWLSDRLHLRKYGRLIFNDVYFALKNGAVASNTKNLAYQAGDFLESEEESYVNKYLKASGKYNYSSIFDIDKRVFSKSEVAVLDLIYLNFGQFDQFELSDLSHDYPEWSKFKNNFSKGQSSYRFEIDYLDFFTDPSKNNHKIFSDTDKFIESSREHFEGVE